MAKKNIEGQLDMFELFGSVEELEEQVKGVPEAREKQAVLEAEKAQDVPEAEEEKEQNVPEAEWEVVAEVIGSEVPETPVMQRCFSCKEHQGLACIAYLDYHKVYIKLWEQEPVIYQFASTGEAVDFYVKQLELFRGDKKVKLAKETEALQEAPVKKWMGGYDCETGRIKP